MGVALVFAASAYAENSTTNEFKPSKFDEVVDEQMYIEPEPTNITKPLLSAKESFFKILLPLLTN